MTSEREIKERIKSIGDTMQITKAMKLVSAAKLKQARNQLERTLPYFERIELTIAEILIHDVHSENIYFDKRAEKKRKRNAYLILTGDKSLCGGYNNNIFKFAERYLKRDIDPLLLICGNTGKEYFKNRDYDLLEDFFYPIYSPTVNRARNIQEKIMELFREEKADNVFIIYTLLKNSFTLVPHAMRLIPLTFETLRKELGLKKIMERSFVGEFIYEPSMKEVFEVLIPKYVKGIIYTAFVEAYTSEQSARMNAMENATNNAEEMISDLKLVYNRRRQNMITQEITEIISGAEVLDG